MDPVFTKFGSRFQSAVSGHRKRLTFRLCSKLKGTQLPLKHVTLPDTNIATKKNNGWKITFLLGWLFFSGAMLTWQGQTTSTNLSNSSHLTQFFYHVERNILWLTANLPRMPPVGVMSYLILFRLAQKTSNDSPCMKSDG